jgi:hypothetical protein
VSEEAIKSFEDFERRERRSRETLPAPNLEDAVADGDPDE